MLNLTEWTEYIGWISLIYSCHTTLATELAQSQAGARTTVVGVQEDLGLIAGGSSSCGGHRITWALFADPPEPR